MRTLLLLSLLVVSSTLPAHEASPRAQAAASPARHVVRADDGHELALWSKTAASPKGTILLLHGRTWSALPNFDLQVPGTPRSVMEALAYAGYAAYALDQRGHGATPRDDSGWLTPQRAADDLLATAGLIRQQHPGLPPPVVIGYSQGALTTLLAAQQQPEAFSAIVLYGFPADIDVPRPEDPGAAEPLRAPTTHAAAGEDFVVAGAAPQTVIDAYVQQAVAADPVRNDWRHSEQFRLDPAKVTTPTLLLHGIGDGYVKPDALGRLFVRLGSADRSWVVLPHSDHAAHVEDAQPAWLAAILDFIERPRLPAAR